MRSMVLIRGLGGTPKKKETELNERIAEKEREENPVGSSRHANFPTRIRIRTSDYFAPRKRIKLDKSLAHEIPRIERLTKGCRHYAALFACLAKARASFKVTWGTQSDLPASLPFLRRPHLP